MSSSRKGSLQVQTIEDIDDFGEVLSRFDKLDIYYIPQYLKLCEIAGDGEGNLAYYENETGITIYPFMKRRMPDFSRLESREEYFDIFSPYGYSGPILQIKAGKELETLASPFFESFQRYCENNNIVSEFIRFHPLLNNHAPFQPSDHVYPDRKVVYINLNKSKSAIWEEMDSSTQRNIKKAKRNNLEVDIDENLSTFEVFKDLYKQTMERVDAEDYYFFSEEYFSHLEQKLISNSFLANVKKDNGEIIASSLFFGFRDIIQYHLGSSNSDFLDLRPNDLLFYKVATWGKKGGYSRLHLGGGHSSGEDSLFRFKASFSADTSTFYVGKLIHDQNMYDSLKRAWKKENQKSKKEVEESDYFPIYRST